MGKQIDPNQKRLPWPWILLIQAVTALAVSVPVALSLLLGGVLHGICQWGLMPLAGFISACVATRKGLLNYAAWILPPAMELFGHMLVWGYAPEPGPVFFCAFISLVGAATGEVLKRQARR